MIMPSKEMYALGSQASVIRDLFAYGQEQAAVVGRENVFDFSIGKSDGSGSGVRQGSD